MEFISSLIKLWRAVSVGRPQTEYAVNRLLIEREIKGVEERTVEERYEREEEEGDEKGIVMSAEPQFNSVFLQTREEPPPSHTCSSKFFVLDPSVHLSGTAPVCYTAQGSPRQEGDILLTQ